MDNYLKLLYLFNIRQKSFDRCYHQEFSLQKDTYRLHIASGFEYPNYPFYIWKSKDANHGTQFHHIHIAEKKSSGSYPICLFDSNYDITFSTIERPKKIHLPEKYNIDKLYTFFQTPKEIILNLFQRVYSEIWISI